MTRNEKIANILNSTARRCNKILEIDKLNLDLYLVLGLLDYDPISTSDLLEKISLLTDQGYIDIAYFDLVENALIKGLKVNTLLLESGHLKQLRIEHSLMYSHLSEWAYILYFREGAIFYAVGDDEAILYHQNINLGAWLSDYIYKIN